MSGDEKARVTAKIRALFAKTEASGATVAEAAAAAAKASELITTYNLTLEDLEVRDQGSYQGDGRVHLPEEDGAHAPVVPPRDCDRQFL